MSTIVIKYSVSIQETLHSRKEEIRAQMIEATAEALGVEKKGVIVEFEAWSEPKAEQAPDVLFHAETSLKRRHLLTAWSQALLFTWKKIVTDWQISPMRVAVKSYVIDSEWLEETL